MSRKSDRSRQKRLQRKRNKRTANRASRRHAGGPFDSPPTASPRDLAIVTCLDICEGLLEGCGRLDEDMRPGVSAAARVAGGIWTHLPFELEKFLHEGAPWSLTCSDLESVREDFEQHDAEGAFNRLWSLALTNESEYSAFVTEEDQDCPHRAAVAFQELRSCLDDSRRDPAKGLRAVAAEIEKHSDPGNSLGSTYNKLLRTAIASLRASASDRAGTIGDLVQNCQKVLNLYSREQSSDAWWHCGRLFLAEVFERHAANPDALSADPELMSQLLGPAEATVWMAQRTGAVQSLRSVHFQNAADPWRRLLEQRIDPLTLVFDDRVRYEIARLKLLRAHARQKSIGSAGGEEEAREFLSAFDALRTFLAHGVPPASRALPAILASPLVDFYVEALRDLHCEDVALQTTESLLHQHPEDFRLGCLFAAGAAMRSDHQKLKGLARDLPLAHIDTELFAHCATIWARCRQGAKVAAAVRPLLFDRLDREHRKQCLLTLAQQALRQATSLAKYSEELRCLLPYFERDNFVYRELREKTALESGLVFLATMMAPLHDVKLSLTETQSQQWVSHAREIARQSALGSKLAVHYLKAPSRAFALTPAVRSAACAQIEDFQPQSRPNIIEPAHPKRTRRRRRARKSPSQPGLFDALDP